MTDTILHVGFDDTDSPKGMCTTFLAYKIASTLHQDVEFLDLPRLIRFNPNIPWKTRGNGAVSLYLRTRDPTTTKNKIKRLVHKYADIENGANPGLVFFEGRQTPDEFADLANLALWQLVSRDYIKKFVKQHNLEFTYYGNGQGLVGAVGAIGYNFGDHTLELLSYRKRSKFGKPRIIVPTSVKNMQNNTWPETFNSFDTKKGKILIAPHGPDPVFYGIRGENIDTLLAANKMIKTPEQLDGFMIFRSNQGTGDHLQNILNPKNLKPYMSGVITGTICNEPRIIRGGHILFGVMTNDICVWCAVYRPTGITSIAASLILGDHVSVGGGIRKATRNYPRVLNIEFIDVISLEKKYVLHNPRCIKCNKSMKSKGRDQGFECIRCKTISSAKVQDLLPRNISPRLYLPQLAAHRHLSRPEQRLGKINHVNFEGNSWLHVYSKE